ncbi:Endonuclease/exonuclease/phosphatase superfamily [Arabidopsis thaliana x Arabidopsis arenosa]|uniref:Endonuclease/exonuclease/phosphatase superfamily n=1 Tax=Arabidopsis thaliana x Arabidopsis arenosa TaxID=1240361 RepID=A0A8T1Y112_9BRAS|nr:Endonuclease/exonuclease/phosphatase superfamily [Arabidopsis thaliana x Arabidopsis arenosa]
MSEPAISVSSPGDSASSQVKQQSYAAVVNKRPSLKKHDFEVSLIDGVPTIEVPNAVIDDSVPLWEDFLVGRFPSTAPHVAKIHVIVNKIWSLGDKTIRIDVFENNSTSVKFRIRDSPTRQRVLRRGMWNIAGLPMILAKWSPIPEEAQPEITSMPLWVTLTNVPHAMYSWEGLGFLTSPIGDPIRLHPETELCSNFEEAKVFVEVNLTKSLPKTFRFKLNQTVDATVEFAYPWLPPRCSRCEKWGHLEDVCVTKKSSPSKVKEVEVEVEEGEIVVVNVPSKTGCSVPVAEAEKNHSSLVGTPVVSQNISTATVTVQKAISPNKKDLQKVDKEGWSTVSPGKSCKSSEKNSRPLEFGQVSILSASRFSVLEDTVEDTSAVEPDVTTALPRSDPVQSEKNDDTIENVESGNLIWVVWKNNVRVTPVFKSGQIITCSILVEGGTEEFFVSFVYASNHAEERKELWEDIKYHFDSPMFQDKPWSIIGDFNEILDGEEHSNYENSPFIPVGMRDFQEIVRHCSLVDMSSHGPLYTWGNKREEGGLICKKLDRVLVNEAWNRLFPDSYSVFESGGCSDHLRCRFKTGTETQRRRGPFKFSNVITSLPEFLPTLQDYWASSPALYHSTSAIFRFAKKLKALKPIMRSLGRKKLSALTMRAEEALQTLCDKQLITLDNPTPAAMEEEAEAYKIWDHVSELEEGFLKQKSKLHWLKVGDKNNKYFHKAVQIRLAQNAIREIKCQDGSIATQQEDIKAEAVRFFEEFLTQKPCEFVGISSEDIQELLQFRCSASDQANLLREVTEEEIHDVLFKMPCNKAPGPDGYTVEFFKQSWPILGRDFVIAIQSFFLHGFLPKGVNTTILALIPKKTEAQAMRDYRPISCCNVMYKVISKIMANRLKKILPSSILPNQSAFIKDRLMMENQLLASELVKDYHKESISRRCALKIDISKAFDSVQWPFLLSILKAMNLPESFIHLIELCIGTASFSVQVNGELAGFFRSERGLRQGCSLSPYLFVICMNILSLMLDKAAADKRIGFHPRCKNMRLTHLCFADDILVFSDGCSRSVAGILQVFDRFATISGLSISLEKSTLFLAGTTPQHRDNILRQFPFEAGTLPVRYLGLPLLTKGMTRADYLPLIERIRNRISSWTGRFLSFAGRLQLIKSVLSSLTNFWLSAFRLPSKCIKEIESLFSAFLWSGPDLNTKKAKIAWKDVCKPKQEGGLGIRMLSESNTVSVLKLIWRLVSARDSLWVTWVHKTLLRNASFWSVSGNSTSGSWMWRKILKYRPTARPFHKVEVKTGKDTSFWHDVWCPLGSLFEILGPRGSIDLGIASRSSVAEALATHRRRRHRHDILNRIEDELHNIRNRVLQTGQDFSLWKRQNDSYKCKFSSQQTWHLIREANPRCEWYKVVWFPNATPKYSFITWIAIQNRLATGDRLLRWNVGANGSCAFCGEGVETRNHLFFSCPYSSQVWDALSRGILDHRFTTSWESLLSILTVSTTPRLHCFVLRYIFQISIHSIWRERNSRRHGETPTPVSKLISMIDKSVRNRLSTLASSSSSEYEGGLRFWFQTHSL